MIENTIFSVIFDEEDFFSRGGFMETGVYPVFPVKEGYEFFTVNPINQDIDFGKEGAAALKPRRADINVTKFRNFVFEIDCLPVEVQEQFFKGCGINWASIVYSGSKSLHAILSLETPLQIEPHVESSIIDYKNKWLKIAAYLNQLAFKNGLCDERDEVIDNSGQNPSRFTRYPNTFRKDKQKKQECLFVGSRISDKDFTDLLNLCPEIEQLSYDFQDVYDGPPAETEEEFKRRAEIGLYNTFRYATFGRDKNMYHPTFAKVLWAIDNTNISYELMIQIMEKYVIPRLITKYNYYNPKCTSVYAGVVDAYNYKRKQKRKKVKRS